MPQRRLKVQGDLLKCLVVKKEQLIGAALTAVGTLAMYGGMNKMFQGGGDNKEGGDGEPQKFNKGGKVRGQGDRDTVPAMLTPGEFVMSKGAVQQYGVDTMEAMNAAAGGTNVPVLMPNKKRKGFPGGGFADLMLLRKLTQVVITDPFRDTRTRSISCLSLLMKNEHRFTGITIL